MHAPTEPTPPKFNKTEIENNLAQIQLRIAEAAQRSGRSAHEVRIIAVTKNVGIEEIKILQTLGIKHFGENRVEIAQEKFSKLTTETQKQNTWHMIGNLQRRKVRQAVNLFDTIDAIDRLRLAETIHRSCEDTGTTINALVEINVSGEQTKHGFTPEELPNTLDDLAKLDRIQCKGLLTMAPRNATETDLRNNFSRLKQLTDKHQLPTCSMGMSDDFEIAIEEGATEVRIGRALFQS
jgi:pyridoxal phosphate enzyme (YggS family)